MSTTTEPTLFDAIDGRPPHAMVRDADPVTFPPAIAAWIGDIYLYRCQTCGYRCDSSEVAERHTVARKDQVNL